MGQRGVRSSSRPDKTLIIFTKAPRAGLVMTRLAPVLGPAGCAVLHRRLTQRAVRQTHGPWTQIAAIRPAQAARTASRWTGIKHHQPQSRQPLGPAMLAAMKAAPRGFVLLIGSDIEDLSPAVIAHAFAQLRRHDLIFGPAADGGFWLIGARTHALHKICLNHVRWSSPYALADSVAEQAWPLRIGYAKTLHDIDTDKDLARLSVKAR